MKDEKYVIIQKEIQSAREAKKGKDIFYKCTKCQEIIPSIPTDNIACKCGNVYIDIDYFRLAIRDYNNFQVYRR